MARKPSPTTIFLLKSLVPYSRPNLLLSFTPSRFFSELESQSRYSQQALKAAYYRSLNAGYIVQTPGEASTPTLSAQGYKLLHQLEPKELPANLRLIVSFDIPEEHRAKRGALRLLLKELGFSQMQRSVWISRHDHKHYIKQECRRLELQSFVVIYEGKEIKL